MATPTIMDTLPVTMTVFNSVTSSSISYTVPSGGSNKMTFVLYATNALPTITLNGSAMTVVDVGTTGNRTGHAGYAYITNPTSGTLQLSFSSTFGNWCAFTVQDVYQGAADVTGFNTSGTNVNSGSKSVTTTVGNDLLVAIGLGGGAGVTYTHPTNGGTEIAKDTSGNGAGSGQAWYRAAAASAGSEGTDFTWSGGATQYDLTVVALKYEAPPVGPANMKTWNGLAAASVKTMDGLAIASVKTWNGLT